MKQIKEIKEKQQNLARTWTQELLLVPSMQGLRFFWANSCVLQGITYNDY